MPTRFLMIVFMLVLTLPGLCPAQQWGAWEQVFEGYIVGEYVAGCYIGGLGGGDISVIDPTLIDIDADGDFDLYVGDGYPQGIIFFRNVGTPEEPHWQFEPPLPNPPIPAANDFSPFFADLDGDGDNDLFDTWVSEFLYYENVGTTDNPAWLDYPGFVSVPRLPCPTLEGDDVPLECEQIDFGDLDGDGDDDLFIGLQALDDSSYWFQNNGWTDLGPEWIIADTMSSIQTSELKLTDMDADHDLDMVCILPLDPEDPYSTFYLSILENIGTQSWPEFAEPMLIREMEVRGSPFFAMADTDNDGDEDIYLGYALSWVPGPIFYLENTGSPEVPIFTSELDSLMFYLDIGETTTPALADIDGDQDLDLFLGSRNGDGLTFFRNEGTPQQADWHLVSMNMPELGLDWGNFQPAFCDIDNDLDLDLFLGYVHQDVNYYTSGRIYFYRNDGNVTNPEFVYVTDTYADIIWPDSGSKCEPVFCDIDADGDYDLFAFDKPMNLYFYRNDGSPEAPVWTFVTDNYWPVNVLGNCKHPVFGDIDNDGDFDICIGSRLGQFALFENIGTPQEAYFTQRMSIPFTHHDYGADVTPTFGDLNGDGWIDVLAGDQRGGVRLFFNQFWTSSIESENFETSGQSFELAQNYPNPFTDRTTISYLLPEPGEVKLSIYNINGQLVKVLVGEFQKGGYHDIEWTGMNQYDQPVSKGVYLYQLLLNGSNIPTRAKKMIILQ